MSRLIASIHLALATVGGVFWLADPREQEPIRVSWQNEVRPLLANKCLKCHGPDPATREADLRLDTPEGLFADLGGYQAVVAGDPEGSELLYRISTDDRQDRMPPVEHGEPLSQVEVELLRRWVEQGAEWEVHWAYAPFGEIEIPQAVHPVANPIDAYVRAALEGKGMTPAAAADPAAQLRRLHLDLTGLPPTRDELTSWLSDPSDAAWAARVEALLVSPAFAVRWARPWLDAARYADSHGFTIDGGRNIWPWRDWVVEAIDADLPFDQFTIEQLAGDLLPHATRAQRLATGFHRNTQINQEGGAKDEENRVNAVLDRVNTTGSVWLGSTLSCAQCHTHKYDPITQTEYFQLYAFFNQTRDSGVSSDPSLLVVRNENEERQAMIWEAGREQRRIAVQQAHAAATQGWSIWQPEAWASNGPELRPEEDGAYRVVGQGAIYSTYVLQGLHSGGLSAIRLEALPAHGLSGGGPGRAANGNFVLQQVRVYARNAAEYEAGDGRTPGNDENSGWLSLSIERAMADFEQDTSAEGGRHYGIAQTLDERPGWAIKPGFGEPHIACFVFDEALPEGEWELRIELQQEHGDRHTLGHFRMLLADQKVTFPEGEKLPELVDPVWADALRAAREHEDHRPRLPMSLVLEAREVPRETRLFGRGSFLNPQEEVVPGYPAAMNHFAPGSRPNDRLDLARWLMDPRNALVHRVTVNRWWQQLFGTGLVETENDFGMRGAQPSHPELLDWLAQDYIDHGFSRKHVVRRIVKSKTYRQSSDATVAEREADPNNHWLARQRRLRLEGEALRDASLAVSGLLDERRGGGPVQPPQPGGVFAFTQSRKSWKASEGADRYRRSIYTRIWRSSPFPFYAVFDAPAASASCTRRVRSNTPLQALTLANDAMVIEFASALGERLRNEDDPFTAAMPLVLSRSATEAEVARLRDHWARVAALRDEDAAWTSLGRVLLNLDEFLTRP
ncbi:MAG: PSD1 and planctomycete cytochrome C domain-containing protein [Planctomycetes bacterium]|nr:PSD1 and planctomycete cytochrome C domain-containing protein [Planctomycetota bacterium]